MASNGPIKSDKLHVSLVASTTAPCDPKAFRQVKVEVKDPSNKSVKLHCHQLSDSGICVDVVPTEPGRYTLNISYTFEVKDKKHVEAKALFLDGKFGELAPQSSDNTVWALSTPTDITNVDATDLLRSLKTREPILEDDEAQVQPRKVSLVKQLHRQSTLSQLLGAHDVTDAARRFHTVDEVSVIMKKAGLESGNLIFGIDYTASNRNQGRQTFGGKSLHNIQHTALNPYQSVISILGRTLEPFSNKGIIPAYGFGDAKTSDHSVFGIKGPGGFCRNFRELLDCYNTMTPNIHLSGPTNFGPLIRESIKICREFPDYYLLVIVADGQVNSEPDTVAAIVDACAYPISIIVVGVGDGPWDMMNDFDDRIPSRPWDNFNFVNFNMVTEGERHPEAAFAVHALSEVPDQYETIKKLGLLEKLNREQ